VTRHQTRNCTIRRKKLVNEEGFSIAKRKKRKKRRD